MYMYGSHLGGFYFTNRELSESELRCEECADYDVFICEANSFADAWEVVKLWASMFGSGGTSLQYAYPNLAETFEKDLMSAGVEPPEVDEDGFCDLSDMEILEEIERIVGKEIVLFKRICAEDEGIFAASDEEDALMRARRECACSDWENCSGPSVKRISLAELKKAETED